MTASTIISQQHQLRHHTSSHRAITPGEQLLASFPSEILPTGAQTYRLVVQASRSAKKQFVWEILDDSNNSVCVQRSKQTFRSLEDAYNAGKGALEYWRDKAMRAQAKAIFTPPVAPKAER